MHRNSIKRPWGGSDPGGREASGGGTAGNVGVDLGALLAQCEEMATTDLHALVPRVRVFRHQRTELHAQLVQEQAEHDQAFADLKTVMQAIKDLPAGQPVPRDMKDRRQELGLRVVEAEQRAQEVQRQLQDVEAEAAAALRRVMRQQVTAAQLLRSLVLQEHVQKVATSKEAFDQAWAQVEDVKEAWAAFENTCASTADPLTLPELNVAPPPPPAAAAAGPAAGPRPRDAAGAPAKAAAPAAKPASGKGVPSASLPTLVPRAQQQGPPAKKKMKQTEMPAQQPQAQQKKKPAVEKQQQKHKEGKQPKQPKQKEQQQPPASSSARQAQRSTALKAVGAALFAALHPQASSAGGGAAAKASRDDSGGGGGDGGVSAGGVPRAPGGAPRGGPQASGSLGGAETPGGRSAATVAHIGNGASGGATRQASGSLGGAPPPRRAGSVGGGPPRGGGALPSGGGAAGGAPLRRGSSASLAGQPPVKDEQTDEVTIIGVRAAAAAGPMEVDAVPAGGSGGRAALVAAPIPMRREPGGGAWKASKGPVTVLRFANYSNQDQGHVLEVDAKTAKERAVLYKPELVEQARTFRMRYTSDANHQFDEMIKPGAWIFFQPGPAAKVMELVGVCESAVIDRLERQGTPNTHTLRVRRVRAQGDAQADLTGLDPNPKGWRSTLVRYFGISTEAANLLVLQDSASRPVRGVQFLSGTPREPA